MRSVVPEWLIWLFGTMEVIAFTLITWVWYQAYANLGVARGNPELKAFAFEKLVRETVLWFMQASSAAAYLIVILVPPPRPPVVGLTITILLLMITVGVAALSLHDFNEMRGMFDEEPSTRD